MDMTLWPGKPVQVRVSDASAKNILMQATPIKRLPASAIQDLVNVTEPWSRHQFVIALKQAGYQGQPPSGPGAKVSANTLKQLNEMNFIAQFAVVRRTHQAIAESGESFDALAALIRGYANLGLLTDLQWNGFHDVFKARALLYAARLVHEHPHDARALRLQAYARMLAGLQISAMHDLKMADQIAKANPKDVAPSWEPVLKAFEGYDTLKLASLSKKGGAAGLAGILAVRTFEWHRFMRLETRIGIRSLRTNDSDCFTLEEQLAADLGVDGGSDLTAHANPFLMWSIAKRVPKIKNLPISVQEAVSAAAKTVNTNGDWQAFSPAQLHTIFFDLVHPVAPTIDGGEPSWQVLGRLIQATCFLNVQRTIRFEMHGYGWSPDGVRQELQTAAPLLADHPYWNALRCYGYDPRRDRKKICRLWQSVKFRDLTLQIRDLTWHIYNVRTPKGKRLIGPSWWQANYDADSDCRDRVSQLRAGVIDMRTVNLLKVVSPHNPMIMGVMLRHHLKQALPHLKEWEAYAAGKPALLGVLATALSEGPKPDMATASHVLKAFIKLDPEAWAFSDLATIAKRSGDENDYLKALRGAVATSTDAVQKANRVADLCYELINQKRLDGVGPMIDQAAQTDASWPMEVESFYWEKKGNYKKAEEWIERDSEHYSIFHWYFWCRLTGRGDIDAARKASLRQIQRLGADAGEGSGEVAPFYQLEGEMTQALKFWRIAWRQDGEYDPWYGLHAALVADALHQNALRDRLLQAVVHKGEQDSADHKAYVQLAGVFIKILNHKPLELDLEAIDRIRDEDGKYDPPAIAYLAGCFLQLHGDIKDAKTYYELSKKVDEFMRTDRTLSYVALRRLGIDPSTGKRYQPASSNPGVRPGKLEHPPHAPN